MKLIKLPVLLLFLLSIACSNVQVTTVSVPPSVSAPEIVSSSTPVLSLTKTPFPTSKPTEAIPVATLNSVSTLDAMRINLISQFPELEEHNTACSPSHCYGIEISPNGQWIYLTNSNVIDLFSIDGKRVGKYSFYEFYGYLINYEEGIISPAHWSNDGRYLYIASNPGGDGGPQPYLNYHSALVRINLENGTWRDIGIAGSSKFSPNDKFIIYSNSTNRVSLRNLESGREQVYFVSEKYTYFGKFVWSPDSKKIIFVATPENWESNESRFALFMIDLESEKIIRVHETSFPFYYPVSWLETYKVNLNKFNDFGERILDLSVEPPIITP